MSEPNASWSVQLSPAAARSLQRLPHKIAAAIAEFVTVVLPADPYRVSKPLKSQFEGWRVARRGDYRVTFRILSGDGVLYVGRIEHRAHIYRR